MKQGNYAEHAAVWDWGGVDRTEEFDYWLAESRRFGNTVLSLMCAIGEAGAYLAGKGQTVTALDYTPEMIAEGQRRFSGMGNLNFVQGDILSFDLPVKDYGYAFIASTDLHHLGSIDDVKKALLRIRSHLRPGGGLGLELWYPPAGSRKSERRRFEPLNQVLAHRVWKEGQTHYEADTMTVEISQTVFEEVDGKVTSFDHTFTMQLYPSEQLSEILEECGFRIDAEHGSYAGKVWAPQSSKWLLRAVSDR